MSATLTRSISGDAPCAADTCHTGASHVFQNSSVEIARDSPTTGIRPSNAFVCMCFAIATCFAFVFIAIPLDVFSESCPVPAAFTPINYWMRLGQGFYLSLICACATFPHIVWGNFGLERRVRDCVIILAVLVVVMVVAGGYFYREYPELALSDLIKYNSGYGNSMNPLSLVNATFILPIGIVSPAFCGLFLVRSRAPALHGLEMQGPIRAPWPPRMRQTFEFELSRSRWAHWGYTWLAVAAASAYYFTLCFFNSLLKRDGPGYVVKDFLLFNVIVGFGWKFVLARCYLAVDLGKRGGAPNYYVAENLLLLGYFNFHRNVLMEFKTLDSLAIRNFVLMQSVHLVSEWMIFVVRAMPWYTRIICRALDFSFLPVCMKKNVFLLYVEDADWRNHIWMDLELRFVYAIYTKLTFVGFFLFIRFCYPRSYYILYGQITPDLFRNALIVVLASALTESINLLFVRWAFPRGSTEQGIAILYTDRIFAINQIFAIAAVQMMVYNTLVIATPENLCDGNELLMK